VPFAPGVSFVGPDNAPFISPAGVIVTVGAEPTNVVSADSVLAGKLWSRRVVVVSVEFVVCVAVV